MTRILTLFGCIALLAVAGCAKNPVTGESQLALMSEQDEISTGEKVYPQYTNAYFGVFQDDALQAYVTETGKRVGAVTQRQNLRYEFNVVNHSDINAFALPGGKITITRGLLTKMENSAQLAGVLGHELAHVNARHHVSAHSRNVLTGLLVTAGQVYMAARGVRGAQFASAASQLVAGMALASYSRDQERQADALGLGYATASGYQPREYIGVLNLLLKLQEREPDRVEKLFMTHPLTQERIGNAEQWLARDVRAQNANLAVDTDGFRRVTAKLRAAAPAFVFFDQGNDFSQKGQFSLAVPRYTEALQLAPDQAIIWLGRAEAELELGQLAEAENDIARAKRLYPGLFYTRYFEGVLLCKQRRWQASLSVLQEADQTVEGYPDLQWYMGRDYEELGQQRAAAEKYYAYLQSVTEGEKARYAYNRLVDWGYIQPQQ